MVGHSRLRGAEVEWSGYVGRVPCSSKSPKSTPQASQQAFSTSESAPAYFFERDCFVDSFWCAEFHKGLPPLCPRNKYRFRVKEMLTYPFQLFLGGLGGG